MHGAVMAIVTMTTSIASPKSASLLSANSEANRRHGDCSCPAGAAGPSAGSATTLMSVGRGGAQAHARVEDGVKHVHHEVDGDEDRDDHQQVGDDHRPVELVDRVDEELARA